MSDNCNESQRQSKSIAFSFTKKSKQNKILLNNKLINDLKANDSLESKDFVTSIDDKQIRSTVEREDSKELVIPLILNNRYDKRVSDKPKKLKTESIVESSDDLNGTQKETETEESLEELAKKELLREVKDWNEDNDKTLKSSRVIPVMDSLIKNRVPEGFESNDNFDVSLRPIEPTFEDYGAVPVQEFGLALLRGMGWKPGMSIGANTKQEYIPAEPKIRAKGLGLGADTSLQKQKIGIKTEKLNTKEEEMETKKGSFVCVEFGAHKGLYGVIQDFDDDMSRVTVKLTLSKESVKTPVALVRVVSKSEFQNEGKVINKTKFDEYIKAEEKREKSETNSKSERKRHSNRESEKSSEKYVNRSDDYRKGSDHKNRSKNSSEDRDKRKEDSEKTWLLPNLKVRIIDRNYRKGKHYKEKVIVREVLTPNKCCCQTSDAQLLEDIDIRMLETVIPRNSDSKVMVVNGKYRKQLAFIVDRNKDSNEAIVRLLADKQKITLSFDDICEYVNQF